MAKEHPNGTNSGRARFLAKCISFPKEIESFELVLWGEDEQNLPVFEIVLKSPQDEGSIS
jgi:hypothetical protein